MFKFNFPDNIDTRSVLESIRELVSRSNVYIINARATKTTTYNRQLLKNVSIYITKIFDVLGLVGRGEDVGFPASGEQAANVSLKVLTCFYLSCNRVGNPPPQKKNHFEVFHEACFT